jgi:hypothetical protein
MKRPSFQFYVGDWQSNSNLRRCTFSEKGIWLDAMCLMHDGEQYGVLRWPLKELARAIGCKLSELKALVFKGVLKGCESGEACEEYIYIPRSGGKEGEPVTLIPAQPGPIWYSSRMVKDEHVSKSRGKGTRFGEPKPSNEPAGNPQPSRRVGEDQSTIGQTSEVEAIEEKSDSTQITPENRINPASTCETSIDDPPTHRVGDGPSTSSSSSTSEEKDRTQQISEEGVVVSERTFSMKCGEHITARFPELIPKNRLEIAMWENLGADFERHVVPAVEAAVSQRAAPSSFAYFTPIIQKLMNGIDPGGGRPPATEEDIDEHFKKVGEKYAKSE